MNPAGDLRDITANGKKVIQGDGKATIPLIASVIGGVPGVGNVAKPIIKEVGEELTEKTVKELGGEATEKLAKAEAERIAKRYDEIAKNGHPVQRHGEHITEQQFDDRAMYGIDPITGTTDDAFNKFPDGTPKPHNAGKNATKFTRACYEL